MLHRILSRWQGKRVDVAVRLLLAAFCVLAPWAAAAQPNDALRNRAVVVLNENASLGPFRLGVYDALRSRLRAQASQPAALFLEQLDLQRFSGERHEQALMTYLTLKYAEQDVRVIVTLGLPALEFVLRLQSELWRDVPVVFMVADDVELRFRVPDHVIGRIAKVSFAESVKAARAILPGLRQIAVVGDSWDRLTSYGHFRREIPATDPDLQVIELMGLPMRELKTRVAALPANTAIVYTSVTFDEEGRRSLAVDALSTIAKVANAPIVVSAETLVGNGGVGGYVLMPSAIGAGAAESVLRLLNGESPSSIPASRDDLVKPIFDWRQLQKWGVSEARLPEGSEVRFRQPGAWDLYKWHIIAAVTALLLQAALISWLIYEHRRRRRAERASRNSLAELAYLNRRETAGELSISIAHEINQPLTGVTAMAGAALRQLSADRPDLEKVRESLAYVVKTAHAAADIVTSVRAMFKKDPAEFRPVNLNQLIRSVLLILRVDIENDGVELRLSLHKTQPLVAMGDPVQLRQVLLNLILNAIEAMHPVQRRVLSIEAGANRPGMVRIAIRDTGTGVDPENVKRVFTHMFTTKPTGMGMGLSICRSILQNHGGQISMSSEPGKGSVFEFELPRVTDAEFAASMSRANRRAAA